MRNRDELSAFVFATERKIEKKNIRNFKLQICENVIPLTGAISIFYFVVVVRLTIPLHVLHFPFFALDSSSSSTKRLQFFIIHKKKGPAHVGNTLRPM